MEIFDFIIKESVSFEKKHFIFSIIILIISLIFIYQMLIFIYKSLKKEFNLDDKFNFGMGVISNLFFIILLLSPFIYFHTNKGKEIFKNMMKILNILKIKKSIV